jgi:hypothetical protein
MADELAEAIAVLLESPRTLGSLTGGGFQCRWLNPSEQLALAVKCLEKYPEPPHRTNLIPHFGEVISPGKECCRLQATDLESAKSMNPRPFCVFTV